MAAEFDLSTTITFKRRSACINRFRTRMQLHALRFPALMSHWMNSAPVFSILCSLSFHYRDPVYVPYLVGAYACPVTRMAFMRLRAIMI